ncbi:MAG: succinate dehydrogenase, cytochrome b556 subunit [Alphaproteobacteria bacterium]
MAQVDRPLSPHLQVYRLIFTMVLSGLHRISGVVLGGGTVLLAYWLIAAAAGPEAFATAQWAFSSWLGRLVLLGFTFSLFFHLCNGVRHLFWDIGWGFENKTMQLTGIVVVVASVGLTLIAWIAGYMVRGGA